MDRLAHLSQQLLEQTRHLGELTERGETQLLLRTLKRRSVLLHRIAERFGDGSAEERDALRRLIRQILREDEIIQRKMDALRRSIQAQRTQHHQQRRLVTAYRPPTSSPPAGLHI